MTDYYLTGKIEWLSDDVNRLTTRVEQLNAKMDAILAVVRAISSNKNPEYSSNMSIQYNYVGQKQGMSNSPVFYDCGDPQVSFDFTMHTNSAGPK